MKVVNMIDHQDYHNGPGIDYAGSTGCYLGIECLENTQDVLKYPKIFATSRIFSTTADKKRWPENLPSPS